MSSPPCLVPPVVAQPANINVTNSIPNNSLIRFIPQTPFLQVRRDPFAIRASRHSFFVYNYTLDKHLAQIPVPLPYSSRDAPHYSSWQ